MVVLYDMFAHYFYEIAEIKCVNIFRKSQYCDKIRISNKMYVNLLGRGQSERK